VEPAARVVRLMCPGPIVADAASPAEACANGDDGLEEVTSPKDFSFGTTQPLQLPVIPTEVLASLSADSPMLSDEFTFGTTMPLGLPDFTQLAGRKALPTSPLDCATPCTPGSSTSKALSTYDASPAALASRSPGLESHRTSTEYALAQQAHQVAYHNALALRSPGQVVHSASPEYALAQPAYHAAHHWSSEPVSPYMASNVAAQGLWPAPHVLQSGLGYPALGALIVSLPSAYGMSPIQDCPVEVDVAGSMVSNAYWDAVKSCDLEADVDESVSDAPLRTLVSRPSWWLRCEAIREMSSARRCALVLLIFLVLICIAAFLLIICVDPGGTPSTGK